MKFYFLDQFSLLNNQKRSEWFLKVYNQRSMRDPYRPSKKSGRRRQWHPTPVLLPGKSHGRRGLVGCSPWGREESDTTETSLSLFTFMHWRRKWQPAGSRRLGIRKGGIEPQQPTPVFLPGESQGRGSLVGCCLWGRTESDTTEAT